MMSALWHLEISMLATLTQLLSLASSSDGIRWQSVWWWWRGWRTKWWKAAAAVALVTSPQADDETVIASFQ